MKAIIKNTNFDINWIYRSCSDALETKILLDSKVQIKLKHYK